MYALAVNGSPRKGGNTELLLKEGKLRTEEQWLGDGTCQGWRNRNPRLYCLSEML